MLKDTLTEILEYFKQNIITTIDTEIKIFSKYTDLDLSKYKNFPDDLEDDWYINRLNLVKDKEIECIEELLNLREIRFNDIVEIEKIFNLSEDKKRIKLEINEYKIVELKEEDLINEKIFFNFLKHECDKELYHPTYGKEDFLSYQLPKDVPFLNVVNFFEDIGVELSEYKSFEEQFKFYYWEIQKKVIELILTINPTMITERIKNYFHEKDWVIQKNNYIFELNKGEYLGTGSHCKVFILKDGSVLKKLRSDMLLVDPELAKSRLKNEFDIMKKLSGHPNIINVYEMPDDTSYTMERANNSLNKIEIQNESIETKINVLFQILKGLNHIHENSIIHRDLHPGNVLFLEDGTCVISDFGLSKNSEFKTLNTHSVQGATHKYIAPEGYHNMKLLTKQSDIYSIGIIIQDDLNLSLLDEVIEKCTNRDLDMRYNDIEALEKDIEIILSENDKKEIDDILSVPNDFLKISLDLQAEILKKSKLNDHEIIVKFIEAEKLDEFLNVLGEYVKRTEYGKWHQYDIYNSLNYELIMNEKVGILVKKQAYENLEANHGNRFGNPIGRIPMDIKLKLNPEII